MKRQKILNLLQYYNPDNEIEAIYKNEIIKFIKNNKNCFDRSNLKGHMTASGWLINKSGNLVLLMHHKKLNEWFQFGGHADGDYDLLKVAIKETQEESGIYDIIPISKGIFDIDIHIIPQYKEIPAHVHYDIRFLLQLKSDDLKEKKNEESIEIAWFAKDIEKFPNKKPSMIRLFDKWLKLKL